MLNHISFSQFARFDLCLPGASLPAGGIRQDERKLPHAHRRQRRQGKGPVHGGIYANILQPRLRPGQQADAAPDAAHAPHILIFQICSVTPAHDFQGNEVLSGLDKIRHIEHGGQAAVFAVADFPPVDPDPDIRRHIADAQEVVPVRCDLIHDKCPPVQPDMVVLLCRIGRIVLVMPAPGETVADIDRVAESVQLPHARNRHRPPRAVIIAGIGKAGNPVIRIRTAQEAPRPVKRQRVPVRMDGSTHRIAILLVESRIEPGLFAGRSSGHRGKRRTHCQKGSSIGRSPFLHPDTTGQDTKRQKQEEKSFHDDLQ